MKVRRCGLLVFVISPPKAAMHDVNVYYKKGVDPEDPNFIKREKRYSYST